MTAYYNEHDPYAAQWLRNLIAAGHIAPGIVDERSIEDVFPSDLRGFTQCHFFAGIGVWSHALRRSGWADSRPVWTGSCPCQPFSSAGQGAAFDDERHLWPAFHHLIKECKPAIVLGEQVASKDADPWIDLVQADVEAMGYAFGAIPFPSAGVGAPHIRDRLYWVANADGGARGKGRAHVRGRADGGHAKPRARSGGIGMPGRLGYANEPRLEGLPGHGRAEGWSGAPGPVAEAGVYGGLDPCDFCGHIFDHDRLGRHGCPNCHGEGLDDSAGSSPLYGFWASADWLLCRDGRWRPVEPGTFPLVDGSASAVGRSRADWHTPAGKEGQGHRGGRLKGYGNAINAEAAHVFVSCVMEATC